MKSIIQKHRDRCYLCGRPGTWNDPLDEHHVFFGPNRRKSEKYGLKVYLHHSACHIFGENAVHNNADNCREIQSEVQEIAMEHYGWDINDFIRIFGRNYLKDRPIIEANNCCVSCGAVIPEGRVICQMCERGGTK